MASLLFSTKNQPWKEFTIPSYTRLSHAPSEVRAGNSGSGINPQELHRGQQCNRSTQKGEAGVFTRALLKQRIELQSEAGRELSVHSDSTAGSLILLAVPKLSLLNIFLQVRIHQMDFWVQKWVCVLQSWLPSMYLSPQPGKYVPTHRSSSGQLWKQS